MEIFIILSDSPDFEFIARSIFYMFHFYQFWSVCFHFKFRFSNTFWIHFLIFPTFHILIFYSGNVEFGHNGLSYSDSLYRNSKRVEILNTGCQLAPEKISDLDFSSLNELHFNATRRLGIDRSFMGRSPRELQDQGKQLEKFQLVDLFRIKQEMIINHFQIILIWWPSKPIRGALVVSEPIISHASVWKRFLALFCKWLFWFLF